MRKFKSGDKFINRTTKEEYEILLGYTNETTKGNTYAIIKESDFYYNGGNRCFHMVNCKFVSETEIEFNYIKETTIMETE